MEGHSYKVTAGVLRDRRLVTISKRGGTWSAELTDAGAHYLKHGKHCDHADAVGGGAIPTYRVPPCLRARSSDVPQRSSWSSSSLMNIACSSSWGARKTWVYGAR